MDYIVHSNNNNNINNNSKCSVEVVNDNNNIKSVVIITYWIMKDNINSLIIAYLLNSTVVYVA